MGPKRLWVRPLFLIAAASGVASGIGWLLAEANLLSGSWSGWAEVLSKTRFGQALGIRVALLALCLALCATARPTTAPSLLLIVLAGLATVSFAWSGHGSLGAGTAASVHILADVLHLLSAAIWVGALLMLTLLLLRSLKIASMEEAHEIAAALGRFSVFGPLVVATLLATGLINSWFLIGPGQWSSLLGSSYGLLLMAKVALFAVMLRFAVRHRYRMLPLLEQTLVQGAPLAATLRRLRTTMAIVTLLALLVLALVAVLGQLEPPVAA